MNLKFVFLLLLPVLIQLTTVSAADRANILLQPECLTDPCPGGNIESNQPLK